MRGRVRESTAMKNSARGVPFSDEVTTAEAAHLRRMRCTSGNVATFACAIDARFAVQGEGHLAAENDVSRFGWMGVGGVVRVWTICPSVGVREAFVEQLG